MGRADTHLAALAVVAVLLLAAAHGGIALADTPDSPGTQNNNAATGNESGASTHAPDTTADLSTKAVEQQPTLQANITESAPSRQDNTEDVIKKPVDKEREGCAGSHHGKTISPSPQAPPADVTPLPSNSISPALEAPPPADLPPVVPNSPVDPDPVGATTGDADANHPHDHELPVLKAPLLALPPRPLPPSHILGTSVAPRNAPSEELAPIWREQRPSLLRASIGEPLPETPAATGVSIGSNITKGFTYGYTSRSLAAIAAGAMPGIAGIVMMTVGGICAGYRQAKARLALIDDLDRFV